MLLHLWLHCHIAIGVEPQGYNLPEEIWRKQGCRGDGNGGNPDNIDIGGEAQGYNRPEEIWRKEGCMGDGNVGNLTIYP